MAVYDFTTADGAPVRTETGVGTITSVEHTEGRRNAQVRIAAAHLRQPVTGWVDTQGAQWPRVTWARDTGASVWYRVDTHRHRKATAPIDTPLSGLDNMSKTRDLVRLEVPDRAPADSTIALDPFADLKPGAPTADASRAAGPASVGPPAATATDGQRPQGTPPSPPATTPPTPPAGNPSPRPQTAPGVPGAPLSTDAVSALHDVVQAVQAGADDAWVGSCCDDAVHAGATRDQVLHVLDRARRGLDVGLPPRLADDAPTAGPAAAARPAAGPDQAPRADAARGALDRQRDPDGITRPVTPGDVSEPHTAPGDPGRNLVGAHNGMSRRVSPRGNVTADARPWDVTNMDGSLNYGSYAATAVGELVTLASAQRMTRLRTLNHQDPERYPLRMPTPYEVDSLARTLLTIADRIQVHLRGGGRPDRAGGSHKQARFALKEAIAVFPIPWGDNTAMARWVTQVEVYGCTLCDVLAGIVLKHEPLPRDDADGSAGASRGEVPPGGPDTR